MRKSSEAIKEKYNRTAGEYAKRERRIYHLRIYQNAVITFLRHNKITSVFDIGCGSGVLLKELAGVFPEIQFVGLDFSEALISLAHKDNPYANLRFICGDFVTDGKGLVLDGCAHNVLLLAIGPLAYYDKGAQFTRVLSDVWSTIRTGGLILTFHNKAMVGRKYLSRRNKAYWGIGEVSDFFNRNHDAMVIKPFSSVFFDPFAPHMPALNFLFLFFDFALSHLPPPLSKKMFANMLAVIDKKSSKEPQGQTTP